MKVFLVKHHLIMLFLLILFVAAFLRLYKLGSLPVGLTWDEAAIGYNAFGITTVHRDEWLNRMPISFKSFGDYKAAAAIYMVALSTLILEVSEFAIRLPMALAGVVTVISSYWIGKALFTEKRYALFLMLLVALSPLSVHFSRIAFESGIAVSFVTFGIACVLHSSRKPWLFAIGMASLAVSLYAYHSSKIAVPIFLIIYSLAFFKTLKKKKLWVGISVIVFLTMLYPLVRDTLYGHAADRFFMASEITNGKELKPFHEVVSIIARNYALHLDPAFLIFGKSGTYRHGNGQFGVLSFVEFGLVLTGIFSFFKDKRMRKYWWVLAFVLAAILPATIGDDAPHSNRAHLVVPWVQVLAVFGLQYMLKLIEKKHHVKTMCVIVVLLAVQLLWQVNIYSQVYTSDAARDFQYGYKEAAQYALANEKNVHSVLFTSAYGQPYIYILLYKQLTPIEYQQGALANYEIRDINWSGDQDKKNILIVGTPMEIPDNAEGIVKEITFPDGNVAFRILQR